MNQDDRGAAKYGKHMLLSVRHDHPSVYVKCLSCKQEWHHLVGARDFPASCQPASEASADA